MRIATILFVFSLVVVLALQTSACRSETRAVDEVDAEILFVYEIQPLLESKCLSCHGQEEEKIEGGLDLRSQTAMLAGGDSGAPPIIAGSPEQSPLYRAIQRSDPNFAMPPRSAERLTAEEIRFFHDWIQAGAPWPDERRQSEILAQNEGKYPSWIRVKTTGGQSENWEQRLYKLDNLWAYLPMGNPEIPQEYLSPKTDNPIDAFINRKLAEQQLKPAPTADKRTLIRRATFDLLGLPPTEAEIDAFLADDSPEAFEKVVDRLLDSPHYGEQWGRRWLDIVRYADSGGFSNDYSRPNAWRYRDYVIRAFNDDKPYDQFVIEQLAGDEIDPNNPEMLIAVGFLRMGPWEHTGMSVAAETRQFFLDDVTNIVGEAFLSTPLSCAKCHDHKYDPIATKDYYRIQAVFATTQFAEREAPFLATENTRLSPMESQRIAQWIDWTTAEQKELQDKEENAARAWFAERGRPYLSKRERRKLPDDRQPPRYYGLSHQDLGYRKVLGKRKQILQRTQDRFDPLAFSVYNGPLRAVHSQRPMRMPKELVGEAPPAYILGGGSVYSPTEMVDPGVLSVIEYLQTATDGAPEAAIDTIIPNSMYGRRLAFARWLCDPEHPITSRSIVNRIWQYHFGQAIAGNPNNFGATGKKPTHPELLDWLARHFTQNDWSIKNLHRLIMLSEAYQRSGHHPRPDKLTLVDPDNHYLAAFSPQRLEAEEIRDAMLFISGELNPEMGGLPVRPEINREVAFQPRHIMGSISQAYQPSRTPEDRNRRTIYAERFRTLINPFMEVFNQPGADLSCENREESTVAPQAFTLFNSEHTRNRAVALADRLRKEYTDREDRIRAAMQLVWNRDAKAAELRQAKNFLVEMTRYHEENPIEPQPYPTKLKREMFEEMTGEAFTYTERLDIYEDYTPDLKDWDVEPTTRALADLAVVLFNSSEFIYVY